MNPPDTKEQDAASLRSMVEAALARLPGDEPLPAQALLHELQVHQIELETQNEALRQAQIALAASCDRYVDLYEFAPVGYLTLRLGMIADINLTGARLLGVHRAKLLGKRLDAFVADNDRDRWHRHVVSVCRGGAPGPVELRLLRGDGTLFHAQLDAAQQKGVEADPAIRIALSDISERVLSSDKLRQLSLAVEQSYNGVVITDLAGRIEYVNAAFVATTGYSVEETLGRNPCFLQSGLTPRESFEDLWRTLGDGETWRGEFINRRKNGEVYPVSQIISPVRQTDGRVTHYIGIQEDLSERRENELALQRSLRRWSLAADSAGIGVWELDLVCNRVTWDDQMCRLYGLDPGGFEGSLEGWWKRVHRDDVERASHEMERAIQGEATFDTEFRIALPDCKLRTLKANGQIVRNTEGRPLTMIGINQDITRRRRAEDALNRTAQRLKRLSGRVLEIQEAERRRLAIELHDETAQALTAIKIRLQSPTRLAGRSTAEVDTDTIAIVETALQQVRRLALALRPAMLDDLGLVAALRWLAEQSEARGDIVVTLQAEELQSRPPPEVETACFRIAQEALANIARHAQARLVEIGLHQEARSLLLRIRDDGCGFDPTGMRERALAGNSMGLLGMEERAALIDGQLAIESAPGQGSTVTLRCPLQPREEPP